MTPSDLSSLINTEAHKILADRQLDVTVLPEQVVVERPRNPEHGDYATNLALQIAKKVGMNPRELASLLVDALSAHDEIATVDIAGPGFINIRLAAAAQGQIVADILAAGTTYGHNSLYSGERINLEFVSANPTGPVHLGSTRWAAVGDSLGRILAACGADVTREYYFNDHGRQIDRFTNSLIAAAKGQPVPEDGYGGDYITEIAANILAQEPGVLQQSEPDMRETFRALGVELMFDHIKTTLHEFGVDFDVYFHENSLFESGAVDRAVDKLKENGNLYFSNGAWWLRSTNYGDDKDRVVIKSDGDAAYIAGDIAYVANKFERGHTRSIYMLGADHHGYISRLRAAVGVTASNPDLSLLTEDHEGTLIRTLGEYPTVVKAAAELREPHRIARYIEELAGTFHRFYDTCQILPKAGEQAQPIHTARLALATATRQVIANALGLLGVTAPEQM